MKAEIQCFEYTCGLISKTLTDLTRRATIINFYRIMATPVLIYGTEIWVLTQKDMSKIQATDI